MNKRTTRMSLLLLSLLTQLGVAQLAKADATDDWSPWEDNSPGTNNPNYNYGSNYQPNPDQTRTGTNGGNLLESGGGEWVGYALYSSTSSTFNGQTTTGTVTANNKLAMLTLNPQFTSSDIEIEGYPGTLTITSDVAAFNMSFDSANQDFSYYSSRVFTGFYGSSDEKINYSQVSASDENSDFYGIISLERRTKSETGNSTTTSGFGVRDTAAAFGKTLSASDIATMASLYGDRIYSMGGASVLGSQVGLSVNFNDKSWQGEWGGAERAYNAFSARGTISGATLTSTNVTGVSTDSPLAIYDVQGGSVKGTLVGIAQVLPVNNNQISIQALPERKAIVDVAAIGSTTLNVGSSSTITTVVNDVFMVRD